MAKLIKAPNPFKVGGGRPIIFLAGSIEMGVAENWQARLEHELRHLDVVILNPRRDDWDSSWEQSIHNESFVAQVTWELEAQEAADIIAMYFDPSTKSPITLLELGLFGRNHDYFGGRKLIVCCPDGFWRKGNVDIVCKRYGIEMVASIDDLVRHVKERAVRLYYAAWHNGDGC